MTAPARVLVFPVESAVERAAHSVVVAVEDLDAALWQANTLDEIAIVRKLVEDMQRRLIITATVAETREQYPL